MQFFVSMSFLIPYLKEIKKKLGKGVRRLEGEMEGGKNVLFFFPELASGKGFSDFQVHQPTRKAGGGT